MASLHGLPRVGVDERLPVHPGVCKKNKLKTNAATCEASNS
jgi:hypothetical protein